MSLARGTRLGPYEIIAPIGAGGMGEVYRAKDSRLGRDVAIKVLPTAFAQNADRRARFEREAKAVAALNHPNICQIYDIGPDYLVMEYIVGAVPRGPLAPVEVVRLALGITAALGAAHSKGITHRDLKPANVLVTASGIKLLDFGLARFDDSGGGGDAETSTALSNAGDVMGTYAYMSPEQAQGKRADARSDIFALGLLLYELLSGRQAFAGDSVVDTMAAIIRDEPAPLRLPPGAPAGLADVVMRCLRKAPLARFQTMSDVRVALETPTPARVDDTPSIAVLPFLNMSGDKENEYFSDGLAEEILNLLAKIPGLRVIARTSSFAFRGKDQDITKIAEALRVRTILEGSVRRAGNRIRITAQLVEAENGSHLWSERYDRDMTDVFAMQDEIGQAISTALRVRLAPPTRVLNIDAWEHWLKGVHYRARNTPDDLAKAIDHFEQAARIDPTYAKAHSGLSLCYYVLAALGIRPVSEIRPVAMAAAEKALAIDAADSEAHTVLGLMAGIFNYQWHLAEAHHLKSLACEPVSPRATFCHAIYNLVPTRRVTEGLAQSRLALQADPLSPLFHFGVAWCLFSAGEHKQSIAHARQAMEIHPDFHLLLLAMGSAEMAAGVPDDAVSHFKRLVEVSPWLDLAPGFLAAAYMASGDSASAEDVARDFTRAARLSVGGAAYYASRGAADSMFEALDAACERRDLFLPNVQYIATFDPYRADPRYGALLGRMNL